MKRRTRYLLLTPLILAAIVAATLWLARDVPRRKVQAVLSERLGAEVRVGRLEVRGPHEFALCRVTIRRMASQPRLEKLRVGTVVVRGSLTDIIAGRIESLAASDIDARLAPIARDTPIPEAVDTGPLWIGLLEVSNARCEIRGTKGSARFDARARFRGIGSEPEGDAHVSASRLPLSPVVELAAGLGSHLVEAGGGTIEGLHATVLVEDGGKRIRPEVRAGPIGLTLGEKTVSLPESRWTGTAAIPAGDGPIRIDVVPTFADCGSVSISGEIDARTGALAGVRASIAGLNVDPWLDRLDARPEGWRVQGSVGLEVGGSPGGLLDWMLTARLPDVRAELEGRSIRLSRLTADVAGQIALDAPAPGGPVRGRVEIRGVEGALAGYRIPQSIAPLTAEFDGSIEGGERARVAGTLKLGARAVGSARIRGDAVLDGERSAGSVRWSWKGGRLDVLAALARSAGLAVPESVEVHGELEASGTAAVTPSGPSVAGTVAVEALRVDGAPSETPLGAGGADSNARSFVLRNGSLKAEFDWPGTDRPIAFSSIALRATAKVEPLDPVDLEARGRATLVPASGEAAVRDAEIRAPELGRLTFEGDWKPGSERPGTGKVRLDDGSLSRWRSFLAPLTGDPAPRFSIRGAAMADLAVTVDDTGSWNASGTAAIRESGFESDDGARVAEGFETAIDLEAEGAGDRVRASGRARVGGFQLLWGSFYADYSDLTAELDLAVTAYLPRGREARAGRWRGRATLSLPRGPVLEGEIDSNPEGNPSYAGSIRVEEIEAAFERYLRRPLQGSVRIVDRMLASGSLGATVRGEVTETGWTARGALALDRLQIGGSQGDLRAEALDLDLPFDLTASRPRPDAPLEISGEERKGSLRLERLVAGGIEIPATSTGLLVRGDTVRLEEGLAVPLLGGILGFEELTLTDLLRPSRHLESAVLLHGIGLRHLTEAYGLPALEGTVEGYFPKVFLTEKTFRMDGDGEFALLGGSLRITGIAGQDLLSRYPKLSFSAEFRDIDLGNLTRTFDFGEMTGTLQGSLRDCELFRGVPVRFEGRIETVHRKGISRTINVKAINNIAILGTGGKVGVLDRGIQRFFKRYTYERLGIEMRLDNDRFLLRGLERRGDRELFLKGRFPFPIDVVNVRPGQTVSFRTMMERAKSLDFSTATTAPAR